LRKIHRVNKIFPKYLNMYLPLLLIIFESTKA
jgi:hypothetical protein